MLPVSGSTIAECKSSSSFILKQDPSLMKERILGNLFCCKWSLSFFLQPEILAEQIRKEEKEKRPT